MLLGKHVNYLTLLNGTHFGAGDAGKLSNRFYPTHFDVSEFQNVEALPLR